jgi:hypothetical protein
LNFPAILQLYANSIHGAGLSIPFQSHFKISRRHHFSGQTGIVANAGNKNQLPPGGPADQLKVKMSLAMDEYHDQLLNQAVRIKIPNRVLKTGLIHKASIEHGCRSFFSRSLRAAANIFYSDF